MFIFVLHFLPCFFLDTIYYALDFSGISSNKKRVVFFCKEDWQFVALQSYFQTFSNLISASLNLAVDSCEVPILIIPTLGFA